MIYVVLVIDGAGISFSHSKDLYILIENSLSPENLGAITIYIYRVRFPLPYTGGKLFAGAFGPKEMHVG